MPPHGDELPSFPPSIPHSTQNLPKTPADPAAQIPPNTAMDMEALSYVSPFDDYFGYFSLPPPGSPQIYFSEINNFPAPANAPEDGRPLSMGAYMPGVNDAAATQAAAPVPVGRGGYAAPPGTTEIQHLEEDAQRRLDLWKLGDVEQHGFAEVEPLTAPDEKLAPAPDGHPSCSCRDADMAEVNAAVTQPGSLPLDVLRQITNNFSDDQVLGEGGFGVVYKGVLRNGAPVAIKRLGSFLTRHKDVQFENEARHLMTLKHPNIVGVVGYCYETVRHNGTLVHAEKSERLLCMEYMQKGSLRRHLSDETSGLVWNTRYKIIKGICSGLHYLHEECLATLIHLDLKPENILLDNNMVAKIADFGLSRLFGEEQTRTCNTSCKETRDYMAPEYLENDVITKRSDIFSLGATIMEIITGRKDYPTDETETASQQYIDLVLNNWRRRPAKAQGSASQDVDYQQIKKCIQIGLLCVKFDPVKRPTIKQIIKRLETSDEAYQNKREEEAQQWFDSWKRTILQDLFPEVLQPDTHSRISFQKFNREELRSRMSSWERMNSRDFQSGELPDSKGVSIVSFAGPDPKGIKPHQGPRRWKEKSMKGMRAIADPSPQPPGQQQQGYVGLKKTLELDDDGNGNKWRAHEYTPLLPSDDGTNKLIPAEISLRVEFKQDELPPPPSALKRSRTGAPKDANAPKFVPSGSWDHMTKLYDKITPKGGSKRKKPYYKVMYAICHHCDQVFNADSERGTHNLNNHKKSCKCNCTHSLSPLALDRGLSHSVGTSTVNRR